MTNGAIHHVTALAKSPAGNVRFYADVLGLRLVKRTVNFDDPGTWHLYFGDEAGRPGTIMTFFPYPHAARGRRGHGEVGEVAFAIPETSLGFWTERLAAKGVNAEGPFERFGNQVLRFEDPDGLILELVADPKVGAIEGWASGEVPAAHAVRGVFGVALWLAATAATAKILTAHLGYRAGPAAGDRTRYLAEGGGLGEVVDLVHRPDADHARLGAGSVHHVALRAANDAAEAAMADAIAGEGLHVTEQRDRNYFRSVYFREPGGVLFEIATDEPGFAVDEPMEALGQKLKLPAWFEPRRAEIEATLPSLGIDDATRATEDTTT